MKTRIQLLARFKIEMKDRSVIPDTAFVVTDNSQAEINRATDAMRKFYPDAWKITFLRVSQQEIRL